MGVVFQRLRKFSIYDFMVSFLFLLGIVSGLYLDVFLSQNPLELPGFFLRLLAVPLFAALVDFAVKSFILKRPASLPKTALISGLLVVGIVDTSVPLQVVFAVAALAVLSKHIIRSNSRNIFNPTGFGISLSMLFFPYVFGVKVFAAWWIASTLLVVPLGLFISYKMEKLPLTLAFFATYCSLLLLLGRSLSSIAEPVFVSTFFFFASFMLLEPRTSPYTLRAMVVGGIFAGSLCTLLPSLGLPLDTILLSLLAMNVFKGTLDKILPDRAS